MSSAMAEDAGGEAEATRKIQKKTFPCPYEDCQQLERAFSCNHNLKQHIRERHTLERPYRCEECWKDAKDSSFTRSWGLRRHLRNVHGIEQDNKSVSTTETEPEPEDFKPTVGPSSPYNTQPPHYPREASPVPPLACEVDSPSAASNPAISEPQFDDPPGTHPSDPIKFGRPSYLVNEPTECFDCRAVFNNREACLTHQHQDHHEPYSDYCGCSACGMDRWVGEVGDDMGSFLAEEDDHEWVWTG